MGSNTNRSFAKTPHSGMTSCHMLKVKEDSTRKRKVAATLTAPDRTRRTAAIPTPMRHLHGPDGLPALTDAADFFVEALLGQQKLVKDLQGAPAIPNCFQTHGGLSGWLERGRTKAGKEKDHMAAAVIAGS